VKVVQDWCNEISLAEQGVLLLALRGPDGCSKESVAKKLTRALRGAVMVGAHPKGYDVFMGDHSGLPPVMYTGKENDSYWWFEIFLNDHDQYPHHWLMHLVHAAEVLGYRHPDNNVRMHWLKFYTDMCDTFHMTPETEAEMTARLRERRQVTADDLPNPLFQI